MSQAEIEVGMQVATVEGSHSPAPVDVNALMLAALEQGEAGVAALEKLVELEERVAARNARTEFSRAFAAFRAELPPIPRRAKGTVRSGRAVMYADLDVIQEYADPLLKRHGFTYQFTTASLPDGYLFVTCTLDHEAGHSRTSTFPVPLTNVPQGTPAQNASATHTYGKRLTLSDVLGIQTTSDLDGVTPGDDGLTDEQVATLQDYCDSPKVDTAAFLRYMKVNALSDIPAARYDEALRALRAKVGV